MRRQVANDSRIAALADAQHGVVARWQLVALGLSGQAVDRRVRGSRLHLLHRGVYAVGHRVLTVEGRWMAAVLAGGAVLSHVSAAGMGASAAWAIHVTVPATGRAPRGIAAPSSRSSANDTAGSRSPRRSDVIDLGHAQGRRSSTRSTSRARGSSTSQLRSHRPPDRPGSPSCKDVVPIRRARHRSDWRTFCALRRHGCAPTSTPALRTRSISLAGRLSSRSTATLPPSPAFEDDRARCRSRGGGRARFTWAQSQRPVGRAAIAALAS